MTSEQAKPQRRPQEYRNRYYDGWMGLMLMAAAVAIGFGPMFLIFSWEPNRYVVMVAAVVALVSMFIAGFIRCTGLGDPAPPERTGP